MSKQVPLRLVTSKEQGLGDSQLVEIAVANNAVPVLWLSLFEHEELEIRRLPNRSRALFGLTTLEQATTRIESTLKQIPDPRGPAFVAAKSLHRELEAQHEDGFVALYPSEIFAELSFRAARAYLAQLMHLCDLWQHLRGGTSWSESRQVLERISPEVNTALDHPDKRLARYYLIGSLADKPPSLDDFRIRQGAQEDDTEPEALAVGEQGLLLGRFEGQWRLLSSGTKEDLRGVWGDRDVAYIVGRRGTIIVLKEGRATVMESGTHHHLNSVFGLGPRSVCAVGESGTVVAFNGHAWQLWPVPTHSPLQRVWGTALENLFIGGQESGTYRFDGYGWNRTPLPVEGMVTGFAGDETEVFAAAGTSHGGLLLRLDREGWQRDKHPRIDWLEGLWKGWDDEIGLVSTGGMVGLFRQGQWLSEQLPIEQANAVNCGAFPMVAGVVGDHSAIVGLSDEGWHIEATIRGLQIYGVWVAGEPKPPRLKIAPPMPTTPPDSGASEPAVSSPGQSQMSR